MFLVIDNYDSFTYNLVQYFGELGVIPKVIRNNVLSLEEIIEMNPCAIVISPGPCTPAKAGVSKEVIRHFSEMNVPIFGVCLGMQSIVEEFGGVIRHAPYLMHGKTSSINHDSTGVFEGLKNPFKATRYHSLSADKETFPQELLVNATTEDGIIMGVYHRTLPIYGVQFHPESILTECGHQLLDNFLKIARLK